MDGRAMERKDRARVESKGNVMDGCESECREACLSMQRDADSG